MDVKLMMMMMMMMMMGRTNSHVFLAAKKSAREFQVRHGEG